MSEYAAAAIILVGGIFYLIDLAFRLSDQYNTLKVFLIGTSFWLGAVAINYGLQTVGSVNATLANSLNPAYWLWVVTGGVVFTFMVILFVIKAWNTVRGKNKIEFEDGE